MSRVLIHGETEAVAVSTLIHATSMGARMKGLLGRKRLDADTGLLIDPCRSIHMWFMRFPIDAVFLDADDRVLKVARGLRPWAVAIAPRKTARVLETAAGAMVAVNAGDQLIVESPP